MPDPSLQLQKLIRERIIGSQLIISMVPADAVIDATGRPERMPAIHIGEGNTTFRRFDSTAYADLHVWTQETGLTTCKAIVSALVDALRIDAQIEGASRLQNFIVHDCRVVQTRFLRDPHGSFAHGVVSVAAIMKEA